MFEIARRSHSRDVHTQIMSSGTIPSLGVPPHDVRDILINDMCGNLSVASLATLEITGCAQETNDGSMYFGFELEADVAPDFGDLCTDLTCAETTLRATDRAARLREQPNDVFEHPVAKNANTTDW